jgi:tetratricopeptide (TPR) repeat protein
MNALGEKALETRRPGDGGVSEVVRVGRERMRLFDPEGYEEAVALFREAITESPDCAEAYAGLAEVYSYWGFRREINGEESGSFYDLSLEYAEMAVKLAPERGDSHRAMAVAVRCGPHADAVKRREEAQTAMDLDPENPDNWVEQWRVSGYPLRGELIRRIREAEPPHLGALIDFGTAQCERGHLDEAVETLQEAVRLHPRNTLAYYNLAMALDRKGRRDQALRILAKVGELRPGDPLVEHAIELLRRSL